MDSNIFYADGTPITIEGLDQTLTKFMTLIIPNNNVVFCTIHFDGTYSINPDLTAEQYKQALGMVIEYFTKGKQ